MTRLVRTDRASGPIVIVDEAEAPTPDRTPATRTREGYLLADAYLARDGGLRYSDGAESWIEYRTRDELIAAAATFGPATPITDGHPERMVDATSWPEVARGIQVGPATVEEPDELGHSYMRAPLLITGADLIAKVENGTAVQTSIGFTTEVVPTEDGLAPDGSGQAAEFLQTNMVGNHTAILPRGRSGPRSRVLLDGADVPVYDPEENANVTIKPTKPTARKYDAQFSALTAVAFAAYVSDRSDEIGAPTTQVPIVGPDGATHQVAAWLAAIVADWRQMKAAAELEASAAPEPGAMTGDPASPEAPPPPEPEGDAPEPDPPAANDPPAAPAAAPSDPSEDPEKDEEMTKDELNALLSRRARLTRLAVGAGVAAETIDTADDEGLARAFVAAKCPELSEKAAKASGERLDAYVEIAETTKAQATNPFEAGVRKDREDKAPNEIPEDDPVLNYLAANGY